MTWLFIALGAYFCYSITTVLDKFILSKNQLPSPVSYAFYSGMVEGLAFLLVPFGFAWPGTNVALLALFAGALFIVALLFLFNAIIRFEASKVAPIVGSALSVFLFALSFTREDFRMSGFEIMAFALLVLGGVLISFKRLQQGSFIKLFGFSVLAAFFFALSYFIGKIVYGQTDFISGFVLMRAGGFMVALAMLAIPQIRLKIKSSVNAVAGKLIVIVGANKIIAAVGLVSLQYAMFLGNVTLVQAMEGTQYVFLIFLTAILSRKWHHIFEEQVTIRIIARKTIAVLLIALGLLMLAFSEKPKDLATDTRTFGVTFSQIYASDMGLDWHETYIALLDDLGIKHLRIPAYWTKIEANENTFDFADLDWQIMEAEKRDVDVVMVVGYKVPRWPECHIPDWAESKPRAEFEQAVLREIETVVMRYRDNPAISRWQVENEPFLKFGVCPPFDAALLDEEIALVRSLDNRPIIVTDSGELSTWIQASKRADIFGTTMYRTIWSNYVGQFTYPLPPEFFHFKANIARAFGDVKKIIVIELQAEPWGPGLAHALAPEVEAQSFSPDKFHATMEYVKTVGFPEAYLWGGEWWYFKKTKGDDRFWDIAKEIYRASE